MHGKTERGVLAPWQVGCVFGCLAWGSLGAYSGYQFMVPSILGQILCEMTCNAGRCCKMATEIYSDVIPWATTWGRAEVEPLCFADVARLSGATHLLFDLQSWRVVGAVCGHPRRRCRRVMYVRHVPDTTKIQYSIICGIVFEWFE
jgi:hypothetical protein